MNTKIKTGQNRKHKVKNDRIWTPCIRFETSKFCIAKWSLATGVSQVSAFLQKELVICRTIWYNWSKKRDAVVQKSKWGFKSFWSRSHKKFWCEEYLAPQFLSYNALRTQSAILFRKTAFAKLYRILPKSIGLRQMIYEKTDKKVMG